MHKLILLEQKHYLKLIELNNFEYKKMMLENRNDLLLHKMFIATLIKNENDAQNCIKYNLDNDLPLYGIYDSENKIYGFIGTYFWGDKVGISFWIKKEMRGKGLFKKQLITFLNFYFYYQNDLSVLLWGTREMAKISRLLGEKLTFKYILKYYDFSLELDLKPMLTSLAVTTKHRWISGDYSTNHLNDFTFEKINNLKIKETFEFLLSKEVKIKKAFNFNDELYFYSHEHQLINCKNNIYNLKWINIEFNKENLIFDKIKIFLDQNNQTEILDSMISFHNELTDTFLTIKTINGIEIYKVLLI